MFVLLIPDVGFLVSGSWQRWVWPVAETARAPSGSGENHKLRTRFQSDHVELILKVIFFGIFEMFMSKSILSVS